MQLAYKGQVWRKCKHNQLHPDPDSARALERLYPTGVWWSHFCCGCCCPHGLCLWQPVTRAEPCDGLCEDMMFATDHVNLDLWDVVTHSLSTGYAFPPTSSQALGLGINGTDIVGVKVRVMDLSVLTNSLAAPPPVVPGSSAYFHNAKWTLISFTTKSTKHGWDTVWKLQKIDE